MKTILTLLTILTVCAATAQTKVKAAIESDTDFRSEIYAEITDTSYQWMEWDIWSYYRDITVVIDQPGDTMHIRLTRWTESLCADTTRLMIIYNPVRTKIDTTIVLNGGQYVLK